MAVRKTRLARGPAAGMALLALFAVWLSGSLAPAAENTEPARRAAEVSGRLGLEVFSRLVTARHNQPVVLSPVSLTSALMMAAGGAKGETAAAFVRALKLGDQPLAAAINDVAALSSLIAQPTQGVTLLTADAIWLSSALTPSPLPAPPPASDAAPPVSAPAPAPLLPARSTDFTAPEARETINAWVADKTGGRIKDLISNLPASTQLLLTNALFLQALWQTPFNPDDTIDRPFATADGRSVTVAMMFRSGDTLRYRESPESRAVILPYGDGTLELVLALPTAGSGSGTDVSTLIATAGQADSWLAPAGFAPRAGRIGLPKLTARQGQDLKEVLAALDFGPIFSAEADFSALLPSVGIGVSAVVHEAALEFDESGTTAAAASAVMFSRNFSASRTGRFELELNRPFLLAVRHVATGALLFLGYVTTP